MSAEGPRAAARLRASTVEHYVDAALYDHEYRRRRADVNFYRRLAARLAPEALLELGCGSGRVLVPLLRDGHRVVGVDLSRTMLRRLSERLGRLRPSVRSRATLLQGDFRELPLGRRFPLVLLPFNAFLHLYTRDDVERFFASLRRVLAPGGRFAFDVLNPDLEWLVRDPHKRWSRTRFKDPSTGETYVYSTNHLYDSATQINWIRLYYDPVVTPGEPAPPSRVVRLAHRMYYPEELLLLLGHYGLTVEERWGGFAGEPFDDAAEEQVLVCRLG